MANYSNILAEIAAAVYTNDNGEITGASLQATLLDMVASLGAGYQFRGVASEGTNPGYPDQNVFYIAGSGFYQYFGGGITVNEGALGLLFYSGAWTLQEIPIVDDRGPLQSAYVVEDGLYFVDSSLNIGMSLTTAGVNGIGLLTSRVL